MRGVILFILILSVVGQSKGQSKPNPTSNPTKKETVDWFIEKFKSHFSEFHYERENTDDGSFHSRMKDHLFDIEYDYTLNKFILSTSTLYTYVKDGKEDGMHFRSTTTFSPLDFKKFEAIDKFEKEPAASGGVETYNFHSIQISFNCDCVTDSSENTIKKIDKFFIPLSMSENEKDLLDRMTKALEHLKSLLGGNKAKPKEAF